MEPDETTAIVRTSNHARGRTKPRNWKAAKKKARLQAKKSRHKNRGRR